jgi:hypothetical protein
VPTPWATGIETNDEVVQIIAADGSHIAEVEVYPVGRTAKRIITAVNMHRDLVAALERCADWFAGGDGDEPDAGELRALIAKAKGEAKGEAPPVVPTPERSPFVAAIKHNWYATGRDECNDETDAWVEAETRAEAWVEVREMYPECRWTGMQSEAEVKAAQAARERRLLAEMDGDGRGWNYGEDD